MYPDLLQPQPDLILKPPFRTNSKLNAIRLMRTDPFTVNIVFGVQEPKPTGSKVGDPQPSLSGLHFVGPREFGEEIFHQDVSTIKR